MFNKQECDVMISLAGKLDDAIVEFREVLKNRNDADTQFNLATCTKFQDLCHKLMEDLVGPTWDEEETTANLKTETKKHTRSQ